MAEGVVGEAKEATAVARYVRVSPYKARAVADLIRGLDVEEALRVLEFSKRDAARPLKKLLESAVANAAQKYRFDRDELYVSRIFVDEGPTLRRWRPRARGRATRIRKRTCHMTIALARQEPEE
ncbi:MAG: 50S ribosomal protein L22 [Acidimicrobiia bacterium]